jgi:hypothetical protein
MQIKTMHPSQNGCCQENSPQPLLVRTWGEETLWWESKLKLELPYDPAIQVLGIPKGV